MASERTNDERASVIAGAAAASFGSREDADEYVYAVALRMIDEAVDAEIAHLARELEEARERERGARRAFEVALEYVHETHHGDILARLAEEGIDLTALSTLQEASDG